MKILVVDDSKAMRSIVMRTLRQVAGANITMEEAVHGADALAKIRAGTPPQMIMSDWNMPEMTGIELLQNLKKSGYLSMLTFGFVTSEGSPEMRGLAAREGASFFIAKPFTADLFESVVTSVMNGEPIVNAGLGDPSAIAAPISAAKKTKFYLRDPELVVTGLSTLLNKPIKAKKVVPGVLSPAMAVGLFKREGTDAVGIAAFDMRFAAGSAALLSGVPVSVVNECVKAGKLSEALAANLYEVFNVGSTFFQPEGGAHLKLVKVFQPKEALPPEIQTAMKKSTERLDLLMETPGYGPGRMMLWLYAAPEGAAVEETLEAQGEPKSAPPPAATQRTAPSVPAPVLASKPAPTPGAKPVATVTAPNAKPIAPASAAAQRPNPAANVAKPHPMTQPTRPGAAASAPKPVAAGQRPTGTQVAMPAKAAPTVSRPGAPAATRPVQSAPTPAAKPAAAAAAGKPAASPAPAPARPGTPPAGAASPGAARPGVAKPPAAGPAPKIAK